MSWIPALFVFNFSLLLLHEMDAIRVKEWKMFVVLKSMREETAYLVFSIVHLPLYFVVIFAVSHAFSSGYTLVYLLTDVFLIAHMVVHFLFRRNAANGFTSAYSNILIYAMGILASVHLVSILV